MINEAGIYKAKNIRNIVFQLTNLEPCVNSRFCAKAAHWRKTKSILLKNCDNACNFLKFAKVNIRPSLFMEAFGIQIIQQSDNTALSRFCIRCKLCSQRDMACCLQIHFVCILLWNSTQVNSWKKRLIEQKMPFFGLCAKLPRDSLI